jgi:predicted GNAT family acetyltransferase
VNGDGGDRNFEDADRELDETLDETFPASDAPANTVETGVRVGTTGAGLPMVSGRPLVTDNQEASRLELVVDGDTAVLEYERTAERFVAKHTEVPVTLRGRHIGDVLVEASLELARAEGLQFVAVCPFVRAYLRRHPTRRAG